jgi:hypothetical protein
MYQRFIFCELFILPVLIRMSRDFLNLRGKSQLSLGGCRYLARLVRYSSVIATDRSECVNTNQLDFLLRTLWLFLILFK